MTSSDVRRGAILIVDDDRELGRALELYLDRFGWEPHVCRSADEVRSLSPAGVTRFGVALVDHQLGEDSGLDLVPHLLEANPQIRIVIMSGLPLESEQMDVVDHHRLTFLQKPFRPADMIACLQAVDPVK